MTEESSSGATEIKRFPCGQCGAKLEFAPGTTALVCSYCGHDNPIPQSEEDIRELDFQAWALAAEQDEETEEHRTVVCDACAAQVERPENQSAFACPYCDADIVAEAAIKRTIKPKSLLPFEITREKARRSYQDWLKGLWFAPNALKRYARTESKLNGMYVPFWTYDADTTSFYTGQRGEHYWDTEVYTTTNSEGNVETKTRQVQRTRWYSASGTVWVSFDDVLVIASRSLPKKQLDLLEPWDLENLVPYADDYLSGFKAESYQISLEQGFVEARGIMDEGIRKAVKRDIGGDAQRVNSVSTQHDDLRFKHVLLPVWISAYRFRDKPFRFLVNARTGEVQGERPYSFWKIFLLVTGILAVIGLIVALTR